MGYSFYGWEDAVVPAVLEEFKGITTPRQLYDILSELWCEYTAAPRLRAGWSRENKTLGQCSITAFLVQDIFGGKVYGIPRDGGTFHCYNEVDGKIFDLTSEQFGDEKLCYENNPEQHREDHFQNEEKRLRYEYLKDSLRNYLKGYIPTNLPGGFFIYENDEDERILFADDNIIKMFGCDTLEEFREYVGKPMPVNELLAYIREKDMKTEFTGEEMNN